MAHVNPIQIQKFLKGVDYPARKEELIAKARSLGADQNVFASLEQLPDEEFETPADVSKAFGELPDDEGQAAGQHEAAAAKEGAKEGAKRGAEPAGETGTNEFLAQVLQDSMAEIQMSELAPERSENDAIKKFARTMIDEHGVLGREIEKLAEKKKLDLPQELRHEHEAAIKTLGKLHGEKFDRAYLNQILKDHDNDIKVFRHYAEASDADADIRKLARRGEKMLAQHLKMAQDLDQKLKH